jgi:hypothetical protein
LLEETDRLERDLLNQGKDIVRLSCVLKLFAGLAPELAGLPCHTAHRGEQVIADLLSLLCCH